MTPPGLMRQDQCVSYVLNVGKGHEVCLTMCELSETTLAISVVLYRIQILFLGCFAHSISYLSQYLTHSQLFTVFMASHVCQSGCQQEIPNI